MDALSDKQLRANLDEAILDRVQMFETAKAKLREDGSGQPEEEKK